MTNFDPTNYISARHLDPVHSIWTKFGMVIQNDPRNKPVEEFFIFLKIQDARRPGGQKLNLNKISAQKSHFSLANGSRSSDLNKILQEHTT